MRIALAQINPTIGDLEANAALITSSIREARDAGADLVLLPELCVCGYPPKDLLLLEGFVDQCARTAKTIGESETEGITAVIGTPLPFDREASTGRLANSLVVYRDNRFVDFYDKRLLPTYDVFDEDRYFTPGDRAVVVEVAGRKVGLTLCEDLWRGEDAGFSWRYRDAPDPVAAVAEAGAEIIVNPSGSPFVLHKGLKHRALLADHAKRHRIWVVATNQVGGNDELIFDGHAAAIDPAGRLVAAGPGFRPALTVFDIGDDAPEVADPRIGAGAETLLIEALTLGVRDYLRKTGFAGATLGLSGGIDSAVTAAIAARAIGPEKLTGIGMPGPYSSPHSVDDARELAERLGCRFEVAPIGSAFDAFKQTLDPVFAKLGHAGIGESLPDLTQENLQSRLRGVTMMAISNRSGDILLTTGNKSEMAVGYATLYGDMNGGLAVLSDITKNQVYAIARAMNDRHADFGFTRPPIPENTIEKPPSAELAPDQIDADSLPPYDVLDEIVARFVERHQNVGTIVSETGFDDGAVRRIIRLININEYKRKQAATGLKVSGVAFGVGRRFPIAQQYADRSPPT